MASIHTLIEDVEALLTEGCETSKEQEEDLGKALAKIVVSRIREGGAPRPFTLRMSNLGKPMRQLWYASKGYPRPEFSAQTMARFLIGDLLETVMIFLARQAGHTVDAEQEEVECEGILGHKDCHIDGVLVDVKTASKYGFSKFADGTLAANDGFGYIGQMSAYKACSNVEETAFWAIRKDDLAQALYFPPKDLMKVDLPKKIRSTKKSLARETPPERCYEPIPSKTGGNMQLHKLCEFCDYRKFCWKDDEGKKLYRTFQYANGKVHLTEVNTVPRVPEIEDN